MSELQTYKFRVEAWRDAAEILKAITDLEEQHQLRKYSCRPERKENLTVTVTIVTSLDPNYLNQIMRTIPDCHVAAESLKLAEDYDGVRDNVFGPTWRRKLSLYGRQSRD